VSPSNLPNKKITSGTRSDSHLLGQDSEVYSEHSSGGSLGSFSFGEDSTTIADTQQGVVGKVLLDDVAESNSRKSSEDASEKQLQSGNKKSFKFVVHDYEVSSPEWDRNASKFFSRWGFVKYGRKKGCPRCKDLYEKGSSSQKHAFTCPSITGVQESSTSSDEIDEDLSRTEVINDAWNFSDDSGNETDNLTNNAGSTSGKSPSPLIAQASKKFDNSTTSAGTSSANSPSVVHASNKTDNSPKSARRTIITSPSTEASKKVGQVSKKSDNSTKNAGKTLGVEAVDDSSVSVQDTVGEVIVNVDDASPSLQDTGGKVFVNLEHPSSSVPDTVDELVIQKSNISKVVEEKVVEEELFYLVDCMYSTAFSLAHSGTLGVPRRIPLSRYEPLVKKDDSFLLGGFTNERTGEHMTKWLNRTEAIKVSYDCCVL
jgi:hypothetical protein